jgi:(R,R)-butanediol dehydrogenase/meso-butanediol dehydrogenase/diacetyl reductase
MGTGMIGMGVVQFLKLGGAGKIIAVEPSKKKAEKALEIGADIVLDPGIGGDTLREEVSSLTNEIGADIVFDCAGIPDAFQESLSLCKRGGQIIVVGIIENPFFYNPVLLTMKEIEMIGSLGYNDEFNEVIELLSRGSIKTDLFISEVIPLSDIIDKGFNRLRQRSDVIKILVRPN